jgi:hypothetical protein
VEQASSDRRQRSRATALDSFLDELHTHRRDVQAAIVGLERWAGETPRARRLPRQLEELLARVRTCRTSPGGEPSNSNGRHRVQASKRQGASRARARRCSVTMGVSASSQGVADRGGFSGAVSIAEVVRVKASQTRRAGVNSPPQAVPGGQCPARSRGRGHHDGNTVSTGSGRPGRSKAANHDNEERRHESLFRASCRLDLPLTSPSRQQEDSA